MAALPLLAAMVFLKAHPPLFVASARLASDATQPGGSAPASVALVARSQPVFEAVLVDSTLNDDAVTAGSAHLARRIVAIIDRIRGQPRQPANAGTLQSAVAAQPVTETLTELSVTSPNADGAVRLVNALANATIVAMQRAALPRDATGAALAQRVAQTEAAVKAARAQAATARATTDPAAQRAQLQARANEAKARYDAVQAALSSGRDIETIAETIRTPTIDRLRQQLREARASAPAQVNEKLQLLTESVRLAAAAARADWQTLSTAAQSGEMPPGGAGDANITALEQALAAAEKAYADHLAATEAKPAQLRIETPATGAIATGIKPELVWAIATVLALALAALILWHAARRAGRANASVPLRPFPSDARTGPDVAESAPARSQPNMADTVSRPVEAAAPPTPTQATKPVTGERRSPMSSALRDVAAAISENGWSTALQTVLVTGQSGDATAEACLSLVFGLARHNMRVLLLDADEDRAEVSRILREAPVSGYLTLHGRRRMLGSFVSSAGAPVWFVPAEKALRTTKRIELPLIVPGVAGHFDVLVIAGGSPEATGTAALARAADQVLVIGGAAGLAVAPDKITTIDDGGIIPAPATTVLRVQRPAEPSQDS